MTIDYARKIEELNDSFNAGINQITRMVQIRLVNPFCRKYRVSFWSGMGGYGFNTRQGTRLSDYHTIPSGMPNAGCHPCVHWRFKNTKPGKELLEIIKALELKGYPTDACPIGAYMDDFKPEVK